MASIPTMKDNQIKVAASASDKKAVVDNLKVTLGDSGTKRTGGYFYEEYNSDWTNRKRVDSVEEMRRGDGTCKGTLRALKAPLLATGWTIKTNGTKPKDEEIRLMVEKSLFGMKRTWKEFLREALAFLDFGHYCFELIWEKKGKYIVIKDIAPRIPHSILKWQLTDGSRGIVQQITTDEFPKATVEIPEDKLLILTYDKEGDDVTGQSVLRAGWKHYQIKQMLYKIQGIAAERWGVGIPVVTLGDGASEQEKSEAEEWGGNVRSNQQGFVVLPNKDYKLEILTPNGNPQTSAIESAIEHHSKQILMSILASFIGLGTDGTGSYALSKDQSSFFLKALEDVACYLKEQITNQVIKRMVDINFGEQEQYPYLEFAPIGDIDYQEFSGALSSLTSAGLVKINSRLIQYVHETFGLPPLTQKDIEMMDEKDIEGELAELESAGSLAVDQGDGMNIPEDDSVEEPAGQEDDADEAPDVTAEGD